MIPATAFPLHDWIGANRGLLRPPTGGKTILAGDDFMITIVGGPNARTDYHVNPFEEFYHQLEGTMTLRIQRDSRLCRSVSSKSATISLNGLRSR